MLLARGGLRVLCLDRAPAGTGTTSTHPLMRAGVLQLARWGMLPDVIAAGTPAVHRSVFHHDVRTMTVTIRPRAGVDALYAPRRAVIDPLLVAAARRAGARVEHGARVTGLLRTAAGRVDGVTVRRRDGSLTCVFAGARPGAMGEALRGHGREAWPWLPMPPELARRTRGRVGAHTLRHVRGSPGLLRQAVGDGWALVGDAGSWRDPLSTHGMTDALRDAELLARAVLASSPADRDALAAYERVRDRLTVPLLAATEPLASHAWDASATPELLRALSSAMAAEVDVLLGLDDAGGDLGLPAAAVAG